MVATVPSSLNDTTKEVRLEFLTAMEGSVMSYQGAIQSFAVYSLQFFELCTIHYTLFRRKQIGLKRV